MDIGDTFVKSVRVTDADAKMVDDRAAVYLEAFEKMGHVAQGIGDRDLAALGVDGLKSLAKKASFPFVSSNLIDTATGKTVFTERLVIERNGVKIGIFGLLTPNFAQAKSLEATGTKVADPAAVAKAQVAALKADGAQIIVAMAHLSLDEAASVAEKAPGIHAMLGSNQQQLLRSVRQAGTAFITDAFSKGKYLSVMSFLVPKGVENPDFVDPQQRQNLESELSRVETRIKARKRAIEQAEKAKTGNDDKPGRARNVDWLKKSLTDLEKEKADFETQLAAVPETTTEGKGLVLYDLTAMSKTLPDDPEILAKTEALKEKHPKLKVAGH